MGRPEAKSAAVWSITRLWAPVGEKGSRARNSSFGLGGTEKPSPPLSRRFFKKLRPTAR